MTRGSYFVLLFGVGIILLMNFFVLFDFKTNTIHTMTTTRIIGLVCSNLVGFGGLWLIHKNYLDTTDFADLSLMFVTID